RPAQPDGFFPVLADRPANRGREDAAHHRCRPVAGRSLRGHPRARRGLLAGVSSILPADRDDELLWIHLSRRPEPPPLVPRGGARRGPHHLAALEQPARPQGARAPLERRAMRRGAARLAARTLRTDDAPPGG